MADKVQPGAEIVAGGKPAEIIKLEEVEAQKEAAAAASTMQNTAAATFNATLVSDANKNKAKAEMTQPPTATASTNLNNQNTAPVSSGSTGADVVDEGTALARGLVSAAQKPVNALHLFLLWASVHAPAWYRNSEWNVLGLRVIFEVRNILKDTAAVVGNLLAAIAHFIAAMFNVVAAPFRAVGQGVWNKINGRNFNDSGTGKPSPMQILKGKYVFDNLKNSRVDLGYAGLNALRLGKTTLGVAPRILYSFTPTNVANFIDRTFGIDRTQSLPDGMLDYLKQLKTDGKLTESEKKAFDYYTANVGSGNQASKVDKANATNTVAGNKTQTGGTLTKDKVERGVESGLSSVSSDTDAGSPRHRSVSSASTSSSDVEGFTAIFAEKAAKDPNRMSTRLPDHPSGRGLLNHSNAVADRAHGFVIGLGNNHPAPAASTVVPNSDARERRPSITPRS